MVFHGFDSDYRNADFADLMMSFPYLSLKMVSDL